MAHVEKRKMSKKPINLNIFNYEGVQYYHAKEAQDGHDAIGDYKKIIDAADSVGKFFIHENDFIMTNKATTDLLDRDSDTLNMVF